MSGCHLQKGRLWRYCWNVSVCRSGVWFFPRLPAPTSPVQLHLLQAGGSLRDGEPRAAVARRRQALLQMSLWTEGHRSGQTATQTLQVTPETLLFLLVTLTQNCRCRLNWAAVISSNCGLFKWERDGMLKVRQNPRRGEAQCMLGDLSWGSGSSLSGENWTQDRRRASPASRRGARQVPQRLEMNHGEERVLSFL